MAKSKTQLLEEAIKIIENDEHFGKDAIEQVKELTKDNLALWVKQHKDKSEPTPSTSAPDPEATPAESSETPAETTPETKAVPKSKKATGDFITSCNGCGLHVSGRLKSCPTVNCKGKITILEA